MEMGQSSSRTNVTLTQGLILHKDTKLTLRFDLNVESKT